MNHADTHRRFRRVWLYLVMTSAILASCAGPQTNPSLVQARTAVNNAQTDPQIAQYASESLEKAEQWLNRAEEAWEEDRDSGHRR